MLGSHPGQFSQGNTGILRVGLQEFQLRLCPLAELVVGFFEGTIGLFSRLYFVILIFFLRFLKVFDDLANFIQGDIFLVRF